MDEVSKRISGDSIVSMSGTRSPRRKVADTGTEAASRVADVLLSFVGESGTLGVSKISRRLGLSKAVVHRILSSLVSRQMLVLDKTRREYHLGPAAATLGAWALRDFDLRRETMPVLTMLQHKTTETATVSALVGARRVYLDQVLSVREIKMSVELGRPFQLHAGASSRVILAFCYPELREAVLSGPLETLTSQTLTNRKQLEDELDRIRNEGAAASFGERQAGAGSVAAPVLGIDGYAIGSISVCGPVERFDQETVARIRPLVLEGARTVSRKFEWQRS